MNKEETIPLLEYKTLISDDVYWFDEEVNKHLKEGWKLYGHQNVQCVYNEAALKIIQYYSQVVIRVIKDTVADHIDSMITLGYCTCGHSDYEVCDGSGKGKCNK